MYDPAHKPVLRDGERIRFFSVDAVGNVEQNGFSRTARVGTPPAPTVITVPGPERTRTETVVRTVVAPTTTLLSARARDLLGARGRTVRVALGCDAACTATVAAEVRVGSKVVARLKPVSVTVAAGKTRAVKLTLTRAQRAKLGRSARVRVTVTTEGAAAPTVELG